MMNISFYISPPTSVYLNATNPAIMELILNYLCDQKTAKLDESAYTVTLRDLGLQIDQSPTQLIENFRHVLMSLVPLIFSPLSGRLGLFQDEQLGIEVDWRAMFQSCLLNRDSAASNVENFWHLDIQREWMYQYLRTNGL
jgi:hypothetical protein